jgi:hypothetical protein
MGTVEVHEFNQEDDSIEMAITSEKPTEFVSQTKALL